MIFRSFFYCLSRRGECVCLCVWVGLGQSVWGLSIDGFDAVARCLELG